MNLPNVTAISKIIYNTCFKCKVAVAADAKFCGQCGSPSNAERMPSAEPLPAVPAFAFLKPQPHSLKDDQLHEEMSRLEFFVAREHFFLAMHWGVFVIVSLIGFGMAWQCFSGFVGDFLERILVSLTPVLWINGCSLACLVYVKQTHKEMARLRERMTYVKFKIDYNHVLTFEPKTKS